MAEAGHDAGAIYEIRVWLPDRPGALGDVAGRIGSVGGDVIGIEILETGGGSAIDDLTVALPPDVDVERLVDAVTSVDGVAVEEVVRLDALRPDAATAALHVVSAVVDTDPPDRTDRFCRELRSFIDGDWAAVVDVAHPDEQREIATCGVVPDLGWLTAFLRGSRHLANHELDTAPGDIVWCAMDRAGLAVASGRDGRTFHAREREQVRLLGQIVDGLLAPG